jgi:hypothetical protein
MRYQQFQIVEELLELVMVLSNVVQLTDTVALPLKLVV